MEELNAALATLIEQATTGIDASVSFLRAELPDVIYHLLMWHGVKSGLLFLLGLAWLAVWAVAEIKAVSYGRANNWDKDDWMLGYLLAGSIPRMFVVVVPLFTINLTWLQIWIAPKVWLLEYAAKLVS